jgi:hypothetical protein
MHQRRTWIQGLSAVAATLALAGCGRAVSEPLTLNSTVQPATIVVDGAKQVKDLTPAEAEAWCTGYVHYMRLSRGNDVTCVDPSLMTIEDGYIDGNDCYTIYCDVGGPPVFCAVVPTVDLCVQNLALHPCEATVDEMNTCAESLGNLGSNCNQACEPLRSHPSCGETLASVTDASGDCKLAVE